MATLDSISYVSHEAFAGALERLRSVTSDDYYLVAKQALTFMKNTIIYVNYTISLMIIVPYMFLIICDIVVYIFRISRDGIRALLGNVGEKYQRKVKMKLQ